MLQLPDGLADVPRIGWVPEPTPVEELDPALAGSGCTSLHIKRDDLCPSLYGGTKPRKLDYLLASEPYRSSPGWHSMGAIGSGHLVALAAAARETNKAFHAHLFWQPASERILENLRFTASEAAHLDYYGSRVGLGVRRAALFLRPTVGGLPVIGPGGTNNVAMLGLVRAGLELAEQIRAGVLPEPARVYVALGTGGTAVGLAVGLGLGGVRTEIRAVATVERLLSPQRKFAAMTRALVEYLRQFGVAATAVPISIDRSQLGRGYGHPTVNGATAQERLRPHGIALCSTYTAKAFAGLMRDAAANELGPALFWFTARTQALPYATDWQERLPRGLVRRLEGRRITRRQLVAAGAVVAAGGAARIWWYDLPAFEGNVLSAREAFILESAARALLPRISDDDPDYAEVVRRVDAFLGKMPAFVQADVHLLLTFAEQATPLGLRLRRASSLPADARARYFARLGDYGGLLRQAYRGLRDLCLLGYYQQAAPWTRMGYEGPMVDGVRPRAPEYAGLVAAPGTLPRGIVR